MLCFPALGADKAASPLTLKFDRAANRIEMRFKNQSLLTYVFAADQFKPYVKELYTLPGYNVLLDAPADHLHHHGLMYAIRVNGVNFWEERDSPGHERSVTILSQQTGQNQAGLPQATFAQLIHWVTHTNTTLADTTPVALLIERRTIAVTVDEANQEVAVDWRGDFEVGQTPVKLTGSDYNGLGVRLARPFDHVARHENSENTPYTGKGQRGVTVAQWSKISHTVDGQKITLTLFDRPGNAGGQARFFTMLDPFAYLSVTQGLDKAPLEYPAGAKFSVNYRLTVRSENSSASN